MTLEQLRTFCLTPRPPFVNSRFERYQVFVNHPEAKEDEIHEIYVKSKVRRVQEIAADALCQKQDVSYAKILHIAVRPHSQKIGLAALKALCAHKECDIVGITMVARNSKAKAVRAEAQKILFTKYPVTETNKRFFAKYGASEEVKELARQAM